MVNHAGLLAWTPGAAAHPVGEAYLRVRAFRSGRALSSAKHYLSRIAERACPEAREAL